MPVSPVWISEVTKSSIICDPDGRRGRAPSGRSRSPGKGGTAPAPHVLQPPLAQPSRHGGAGVDADAPLEVGAPQFPAAETYTACPAPSGAVESKTTTLACGRVAMLRERRASEEETQESPSSPAVPMVMSRFESMTLRAIASSSSPSIITSSQLAGQVPAAYRRTR